jgi:hypothetical protein
MLRQHGFGPALGDPPVVTPARAEPEVDEVDGRLIRIGSQWLIDFRSPGTVELPARMTERLLMSLADVDIATADVAGQRVVEIPLAHPDELEPVGAYLFRQGIYAATDGAATIRLRICATHTWEQIEQLVATLADVSDRFRPRRGAAS